MPVAPRKFRAPDTRAAAPRPSTSPSFARRLKAIASSFSSLPRQRFGGNRNPTNSTYCAAFPLRQDGDREKCALAVFSSSLGCPEIAALRPRAEHQRILISRQEE